MEVDSLLTEMMRSLEGKDLNWYAPSDLDKTNPIRVHIREGKAYYEKEGIEYRLIGVRWPTLKKLYNSQNGIEGEVYDPIEEARNKKTKTSRKKEKKLSPDSIPFSLSASQKESLNTIISMGSNPVLSSWTARYQKAEKSETILVTISEVEELKSSLLLLTSVKKQIPSYNSLLSKSDIIIQEVAKGNQNEQYVN